MDGTTNNSRIRAGQFNDIEGLEVLGLRGAVFDGHKVYMGFGVASGNPGKQGRDAEVRDVFIAIPDKGTTITAGASGFRVEENGKRLPAWEANKYRVDGIPVAINLLGNEQVINTWAEHMGYNAQAVQMTGGDLQESY